MLDLLYCERCETLLLGGTRSMGQNNNWEVLAANGALDQAPERSPNLQAKDRSYQEYAVFWPQGTQSFTPRVNQLGNERANWGQPSYSGAAGQAEWRKARINATTGEVSYDAEGIPPGWIEGRLFVVQNNNGDVGDGAVDTHRALPAVCPCCGVNYAQRRFNKSPIRSFRTGFGKSAELLATELSHVLGSDPAKRKLVAFSDSRDDAARLANDVEREHYKDLVRELIADTGRELAKKADAVAIAEARPDLRPREGDGPHVIEALGLRFNRGNPNPQNQREAEESLRRMRSGLERIGDLVRRPDNYQLGLLATKLADLGVNPGGNDLNAQRIDQRHWFQFLDPPNEAANFWRWREDAGPLTIQSSDALVKQIANTFFGRLYYTAEAAGIGYLCIDPDDPVMKEAIRKYKPQGMEDALFVQILNGAVRILGDSYQHQYGEYEYNPVREYSEWPAKIRRWVGKTATLNHVDANILGPAIFNALSAPDNGGDPRGVFSGSEGLKIERLWFCPARPGQSVWKNERSGRAYLHRGGGVCTEEGGRTGDANDRNAGLVELEGGAVLTEIQEKHYLGHRAMIEQRKPARLHCEELTGQTDDQFERQRHFRDIVLNNEGSKKMRQIDLLSVTTTLEVGVDIGDLQAVMQGNMPPQRFNYQQRVGRAGRRGQAFSVALTYCRGRSHDEHYFQHPERITGEAPPTPFLSMDQDRILKRILAKEVLRQVFRALPNAGNEAGPMEVDGANPNGAGELLRSNVHGEFGLRGSWNDNRKQNVSNWMEESPHITDGILNALLVGTGLAANRAGLLAWLAGGLLTDIDGAVGNQAIAAQHLSQCLAEAGVLPMFGMPTSVRDLYHGVGGTLNRPQLLSIDRPEDMAVNEFAPGAQKTKDKAVHTAIGFTAQLGIRREGNNHRLTQLAQAGNGQQQGAEGGQPPAGRDPFSLRKKLWNCPHCFHKEITPTDENLEACRGCGKSIEPVEIRVPKAYRTDLSRGADSVVNMRINVSRRPIMAIVGGNMENQVLGNATNELAGNTETWRINDNGGRLFQGGIQVTLNDNVDVLRNPVALDTQWVLNNQGAERIAIAARKHTEAMRLAPKSTPSSLYLDPFPQNNAGRNTNGRSHAVRAAYYSAGFILQRVLADKLDIDPTEVEIADLAPRTLKDSTKVGELILADELPNGSGFVRQLHKNLTGWLPQVLNASPEVPFMKAVYNEAHRTSCKDSCYACLKVYRNMNYHSLLDWRLGVGLLRIMNDPNYRAGADGNLNTIEMLDWADVANRQANAVAENFPGVTCAPIELNGIQVPMLQMPTRNYLITHPFWHFEAPGEGTWLSQLIKKAREESAGKELSWVDHFNLHRRMGWCYANVFTA